MAHDAISHGSEGDDQMSETAESVDDAPVSRSTVAVCRRCRANVGRFFNAWHRITTTYYLPALAGSYSSQLRPTGVEKRSMGTEFDACTVDPLHCPDCHRSLGFHVVDAPLEKQAFRGRDLFKLSRIELRCEVGPDRSVPVEPHVQLPDPLLLQASPDPATAAQPTMEVDARPPPPIAALGRMHYDQHQHQHHDRSHTHTHALNHNHNHHRSLEAARPSLPAPPPARSPPAPLPLHAPPQRSPSNPPLASPPVHDVQYAPQPPGQSSPKEPANAAAARPHSNAPPDQRANGQSCPRPPHDVQLDAIERLQTQISQNSSALVAQTRDMRLYQETLQHEGENLRRDFTTHLHQQGAEIRRVDEAVGRLQHEMLGIRELLEGLSREVHATRELQARTGVAGPAHPISAQDSALELMAQQIAVMSHKTGEVETLKITIEIMKNKIQRLEDAAAGVPPNIPASQYASPPQSSVRPAQPSHAPAYRPPPSQVPQIDIPASSVQPTQSYHSQGGQSLAQTPDAAQRPEPSQSQGGWVAVNAGTKRPHANGVDSPQDSTGQSIASPKRPKLAPIEPRGAYAGSSYSYEHMDTDDSDAARMHTHRHTLPSQSVPPSSIPPSTLASQHHFIPYGTQDGVSDDSWRSESQRIATDVRTPRGRGRGGGPGSRGGRVRKSTASHYVHPLDTPEWERDDWLGVAESQISPDGYYSVARSSRGIIRRGSGGGGRGGRPGSSGRSVSLGLQGVTAGVGMGMPVDPYAHTKKTRTKPIRNADGVLIRKDGRPDMRSQSSAANLRKVHARKEEEDPKNAEHGFAPTPSNLQHSTSMGGTETPSPTRYGPAGQDAAASQQKKHSHVMSKIFPSGVEEVKKDHDYARKLFDEDRNHTAQPRAQHHHRTHEHARPHDIKRELAEERRVADTESPNAVDVDLDRPEDHADDEGHTPGGQSDNSGRESQYHDAAERDVQHQPEHEARHEDAPASHSTVESSQTLAAASHPVQPTGSTVA